MWTRSTHRILIVADAQPAAGLRPAFLHTDDIVLESCPRDDSALVRARDTRPDLIIEDHPGHEAPDPEIGAGLKHHEETRAIPLIVVAPKGVDTARNGGSPDATVSKPIVQREYYEAVSRFIPLPVRRCLRHAINLRFSYRSASVSGQAFTRDLSLHGAFLKTDRTMELGTRLSVAFHLPGQDEPLECGAIVRRTAPYALGSTRKSGFAIEFEGIGERDLNRLEEFIERHLQKPLFSF